MEENTILRN